jgi:hypothetical protein
MIFAGWDVRLPPRPLVSLGGKWVKRNTIIPIINYLIKK